jgi:hypothetical protein
MTHLRAGAWGLAAALLLTGCVAPATTTSGYASKAGRTAQAAVSAVRTALLAEDAYLRGRLTGTYLETTLREAEGTVGSVRSTFDSMQPPETSGADGLRATLDPLLEQADSGLTDLRIAARRDDRAGLTSAAGDLARTADRLDGFAREHPA